jgi:penicillin-binding protein 1C
VGNADNTPMAGVSGVTGAAPIWHDFLASIERNTPPRDFARPAGLVEVEICADSGLRAECPSRDARCATSQAAHNDIALSAAALQVEIVPCSARRREWFIAGTEPAEVDRSHVRVALDARSGEPAAARTPAEFTSFQTFWLLPSEFREWARDNNIPQPALADRPAIGSSSKSSQAMAFDLQLTSPDPNRAYRLDPELPRDAQRLPITVRLGPEIAAQGTPVTIYLDDAWLAQVQAPDYTAWWPLSRGRHTFQAVVTGPDGKVKHSDPIVVFVEE